VRSSTPSEELAKQSRSEAGDLASPAPTRVVCPRRAPREQLTRIGRSSSTDRIEARAKWSVDLQSLRTPAITVRISRGRRRAGSSAAPRVLKDHDAPARTRYEMRPCGDEGGEVEGGGEIDHRARGPVPSEGSPVLGDRGRLPSGAGHTRADHSSGEVSGTGGSGRASRRKPRTSGTRVVVEATGRPKIVKPPGAARRRPARARRHTRWSPTAQPEELNLVGRSCRRSGSESGQQSERGCLPHGGDSR